ncbi:hypothetical protein ES703_105704 [subsurface metagenome]
MPGFVTGQPLNGSQVGQALFLFGPSLPTESPFPMPRVLARALFPGGFQPFRAAAPAYPALVPVIPPVAPPIRPTPPANQVVTRPPAPPAQPPARKRVLERGTFPEWH